MAPRARPFISGLAARGEKEFPAQSGEGRAGGPWMVGRRSPPFRSRSERGNGGIPASVTSPSRQPAPYLSIIMLLRIKIYFG